MARLKLFIFCAIIYFSDTRVTSPVAGDAVDDLIITLPTGSKVQGHILKSFEGNDFQAFENIPYAEAPVGKNRLKVSSPKEPWEGVFNATSSTKACSQFLDDNVIGEEDCLVLNVYRPSKADNQEALPVYLWIYGGSFLVGYGTLYNPKFLIDYDIIIVTINYRLGVLGFLTTNDDNIPANLGLKDQLLALQWVHDNIIAFGGDPNQVTIGGESAGSISVGFHWLNKQARGLFSGIIQQSGSPLSSFLSKQGSREVALEYGRQLNNSFNSTKSSDLLVTLQEASLSDIMKLQKTFAVGTKPQGHYTTIVWQPIIEGDFSDNAAVTGHMHSAVLNGEFNFVPILMGLNSEESLFQMIDVDSDLFKQRAKFYDENPKVIPDEALNIAEENKEHVGAALRKHYTNSSFEEDSLALIQYTSDEVFGRSIGRQADAASRYVPVYMYQLSWYNKSNQFPGVEHTADLHYFWDFTPQEASHNDTLRKPLFKWWTNFIKYGNPTPIEDEDLQNVIWPEVKPGSVKYLNIDSTFEVKENPRRYYDLERIIDPYIREPFNTY
ncbi:carboxylic ester hydrolase-like [Diabrotica undecimpunctata]|uniref:carboxylic ester hydrolase-like n=1 Tax=Diabrotica undecimpunctata TaxID=50387 RepID=UPI003B63C837